MAKVYVGTYGKYNNGSLEGAWLDLAKYNNYDEFVRACKELHKDESDPEFMIQDNEGFPDGLDCMEWMSQKDFDDVKEAMKEETSKYTIVDYSEKAIALIGETKDIKDQLKKLGGRFNPRLSCGAGWIFSKKQRQALEQLVKGDHVSNSKSANKDDQQFVDWLAECKDGYYKKYSVGAIKLHGGYYYIDKPHIENRFCFHDEGPDYEYYKELTSNDELMARHFKSYNMREFDRKIERIEKGDYGDTRVWWKVEKDMLGLMFRPSMYDDDGWTLCTDDEKDLILKGLKFGRALFEKRLNTYLKRYGVSKLHTWTYWADA